MKAIVVHAAKDLRIEDRPAEAPGAGQVQVGIEAGGICGSDLHYFHHGGFGAVRLREPMVLGHEVSGRVLEVGGGVHGFSPGELVSVSPSRPCYTCEFCQADLHNQCLNMRFYGSAMPFPHIQGAFQQVLVVDARQCVSAEGLTPGEAAMAEPLAVGLHSTRRAGPMLGKRVLVTGCGPIGALAILAARRAGAAHIVAADLSAFALRSALEVGADEALDLGADPAGLEPFAANKGTFDVLYECSGAQPALTAALHAMRPRGVVLQLGLGGDMTLPMMVITSKELDLRGSFRFHEEFEIAVTLMRKKLIDVRPLITDTFALSDAESAFARAGDRSCTIKTQIDFR